ncbi:type IV secretion system protein [Providencia alcalifaciens]|uniref:virB8 family protein n=1 Tax=Providencia alcalifaciens TaxID=126385 RepID=UPI0032DACDE6
MAKKEINYEAANFEKDREFIYKRSERKAWIVAGISSFLLLLSWVGLFSLLPLKETQPFIVRVDNATGVPDIVSGLDEVTLKTDEALDRYFAAKYVTLRESYTYQTIQESYERTQLYSSQDVARSYRAEFDSPDSVDKTVKRGTVKVKIISVLVDFIGEENIATIRFVKTTTNEKGENKSDTFVAKLSFEYKPKLKYSLQYRDENPLGFFVTSWQVAEESH